MKANCKICGKQLASKYPKHCRSHRQIKESTREIYRERMLGNEYGKGKNIGNQNGFKKGQVAWNKGKKHLKATGENHNSWKGDKALYGTKHAWARRHLGRPKKCQMCGKKNVREGRSMLHWANVDHRYKRILTDWFSLCVSCHKKYDKTM